MAKKDSVTKKDIVKHISTEMKLTQLETKDVIERAFEAIVATLLKYGRIELRNFGVFEVKQRKARKARNPRTGDPVEVPPKNVVTFKPGKEMEERVRELKDLPLLDEPKVKRAKPKPKADAESAATKAPPKKPKKSAPPAEPA